MHKFKELGGIDNWRVARFILGEPLEMPSFYFDYDDEQYSFVLFVLEKSKCHDHNFDTSFWNSLLRGVCCHCCRESIAQL